MLNTKTSTLSQFIYCCQEVEVQANLVKTICIKKLAPRLQRTRKIQSHLVRPTGISAVNIGDITSHSAMGI